MSRPILCSVRKGNPRCLRVGSGQLVSSLWFLDVSELEKIQDQREVLGQALEGSGSSYSFPLRTFLRLINETTVRGKTLHGSPQPGDGFGLESRGSWPAQDQARSFFS